MPCVLITMTVQCNGLAKNDTYLDLNEQYDDLFVPKKKGVRPGVRADFRMQFLLLFPTQAYFYVSCHLHT